MPKPKITPLLTFICNLYSHLPDSLKAQWYESAPFVCSRCGQKFSLITGWH